MEDVVHSVGHYSPTQGCWLIITDDLPTALVQSKARASHRTKIILVDFANFERACQKARTYKKIRVVPMNSGILTDEVSEIIRHW